jgi:hypothetical protein
MFRVPLSVEEANARPLAHYYDHFASPTLERHLDWIGAATHYTDLAKPLTSTVKIDACLTSMEKS